MARAHGIPGGAPGRRLALLGAIPAVTALVAGAVAGIALSGVAGLATGGLAFAVGAWIAYFTAPDLVDEARASRHGYQGERQIRAVLAALPPGWLVFSDVTVGMERVDHVVVSPTGVLALEVKNYFGSVRTGRNGLRIHGHRDRRLLASAQRKSRAVSRRLGVPVQPVLVLTRGRIRGDRIGALAVATPAELPALLRILATCRVDAAEANRIREVLEAA